MMRTIKFFVGSSLLIVILSFVIPIFSIYATAAAPNDEEAAVSIQMYGELSGESADFYNLGQLNNSTAVMVMLQRAVGIQEGGATVAAQLNISLIDAKNNKVIGSYTISGGETAHFIISGSNPDAFYVLKVSQESSSYMGLPLPSLPFVSTPVQSVSYEGQILII